jgi:Domain of unknown function (DUF4410)
MRHEYSRAINAREETMSRLTNRRTWVWLFAMMLVLGGCASGSMRSTPDNPTSADGLTPSIEDKEAGLVAIAPGFDIRRYKIMVVERFPVASREIEDEGDRRFGARVSEALQRELVRQLRESGLFQEVIDASQTELKPPDAPTLRLRGAITRLGRGSGAERHFLGLFGSGGTRAQADMQLVDIASNRAVVVTADRRRNSMGGFAGGSDEDLINESFKDIARDLARFLVRLSVPHGASRRPVIARGAGLGLPARARDAT